MDSTRGSIRINRISYQKCRHDVHKLNFHRNTKLSNLSREEWTALLNLKNRSDVVIKAADKGGAIVVWRTDLYQQLGSNSATLGHHFLHHSQQRPNFRQSKIRQRNHSRTHNQTTTTSHRPKSHHSWNFMHLFQT